MKEDHPAELTADATESLSPDLDDPRVAAAMQEYLVALESGSHLDRAEFLARHADIAAKLDECLEGLDFVHAAALNLQPDPVPDPANALLPLPLGDFRIVREIGRGGMGVVYEAIQLSLGRRVALKVLPFAAAVDPKQLQRFKNEAQAAAQLHHTNIVPVYAVGSERGVHFYAMQLIAGQPLSLLIRQLRRLAGKETSLPHSSAGGSSLASELAEGRLAPRRAKPPIGDATEAYPSSVSAVATGANSTAATAALTTQHTTRSRYFRTVAHLGRQVAEGLEHAHAMGVVHRDIKPANLLIDDRGNVWIADFGLAQFHADAGLTRTGDMLGTLRYMSPEQAIGNRVVLDHRTDVYSLGVTLYELLTLEPVFAGSDRAELLRRIIEDDPRLPRALDPTIPVELETIVLKAISKAPPERYATAQQLADDLGRFLNDEPILARRPNLLELTAKWMRRHRSVVVSALVLLVLATAGLLASTIVIAREHAQTKQALENEAAERNRAEESFRQARAAVDTFTRLSEEELTNRPQLRRKFLEAALEYYQDFLDQRGDDPSLQAELSGSSARVTRLLSELTTLEGYAPLMLFNEPDVQDELAASAEQREQMAALSAALMEEWRASVRKFRKLDPEQRQHSLTELLRENERRMTAILTPDQMARLTQIAWQQRGTHAFEDPRMIEMLKLTSAQRLRIREIQEELDLTMLESWPHGPDHGPPRGEPGERGGKIIALRDAGGRETSGREGSASGREAIGKGPGGRGPGERGLGDRGPGGRGPGERGLVPGDPAGADSPPDFPRKGKHFRAAVTAAVAQIVSELTPEQQQTWQRLVGEPFQGELRPRPLGLLR